MKTMLSAVLLSLAVGCASDPKTDSEAEQMRNEVRAMEKETLQRLYKLQPEAQQTVESGYAHATFSNFGMKIFVFGSGSGEGVAVSKDPRKETFMRMVELQTGLGIGVKKFRHIWVFMNADAYNKFVTEGWTFGGQATAEAKSGETGGGMAGAVSVAPGVYLFQIVDTGLALDLTVKGTKYYKDEKLN
mgnify:CR=1 FL=1